MVADSAVDFPNAFDEIDFQEIITKKFINIISRSEDLISFWVVLLCCCEHSICMYLVHGLMLQSVEQKILCYYAMMAMRENLEII